MTPKQEQFCREYLIDLNATQAAIRAGYSARTAGSQGERLLRNAAIQGRISELKQEREQRTRRTADEVIRRLWQIVEADGRKAFHPDGTPISPADLPDDLAVAMSAIEVGDTLKIKLNDRLKALDLLGKHHSLYTERVEQTGNAAQVVITLPDNGRSQSSDGQ